MMEFSEIKKYWKQEDKRISENVQVNQKVSNQKLQRIFSKIITRRRAHLISLCFFVPLIFILIVLPNLKNDSSFFFYLALIGFTGIILFLFAYTIYYYIRLQKIDLTGSVVKVQEEISRLEKSHKRRNLLSCIFVPVLTLCVFKIFAIPLDQYAMLFFGLAIVVMACSVIIRVKFIIPKEFNQIKDQLNETSQKEKTNKYE